jgi:hypothetical protein
MENVNDPRATPLPSPEVRRHPAVSEGGFLFDPASGHNFPLNETGLCLEHYGDAAYLLPYPSAGEGCSTRRGAAGNARTILSYSGVRQDLRKQHLWLGALRKVPVLSAEGRNGSYADSTQCRLRQPVSIT